MRDYLEKDMPRQILVRYRDSEGNELPIPDLVHSLSYMDGSYYTDKDTISSISPHLSSNTLKET